ncbi:ribonuclease T2-like [Mycoblastus sanguinarius]|nr:ribonuclease T2-like [Mycoblastus sanguinarius]
MSSFSRVVLGAAQVAFLFSQSVIAGHPEFCLDFPLSCTNTSAVPNTCCFNYPGGELLQTQFWDTDPATGPANSWTIHGLWPDNCDGTYNQYCDETRQYTNISAILQSYNANSLLSYMETYWKDQGGNDESFWEHEWGKHGTCISTFDTDCYVDYTPQEEVVDFFQKTVDLFKTLPSYVFLAIAGIVPSTTQTYTAAQVQHALGAFRGGVNASIQCSDSGQLQQIYYHFHIAGSAQEGIYIPTQPDGPSSCPQEGIQYLPKNLSSYPTPVPGSY